MFRSEQGNLSLGLLSLCLGLCLGLLQLHHLLLLSIGGLAGLATLSAVIHDGRSIIRGVEFLVLVVIFEQVLPSVLRN